MPAGHDEIAELLGAYALNAIDPAERTAVEAHLAECPRCRAEVRDHVLVATQLGNSGGDAPDGLWERIAGALEDTAPPMRLDLPAGGARVAPLAPRRRRVGRVALVAGGLAAALVFGVLGVQLQRQDDRIEDLEQALAGDDLRDAVRVFGDPDADRLQLTSPDGELVVRAALRDDGSGYLDVSDLPDLAGDRTYQLWGQTPSGLISLGLLGGEPGDVVAFHSSGDLAALAITEEEAGGVVQSEQPPSLLGRFT